MNASRWSEFVAMGGYGLYVWGSLGLAFIILAGEPLVLWARHRALSRRLAWPGPHEDQPS